MAEGERTRLDEDLSAGVRPRPGKGARGRDGCPVLHDHTLRHAHEAWPEGPQIAEFVFGHQDSEPCLLAQAVENAKDARRRRRIQVRGGFVKHQHLGAGSEHGRDGHALLLAAG